MSYYCEYCNYSAKNSSNFVHHKKTQKHIKNSTNTSNISLNNSQSINPVLNRYQSSIIKNPVTFECENCSAKFNYKNNYYRHRKICQKNSILDNIREKEKELLQKEFNMKLEYMQKEKDMITKIEKEKTELLNNFMTNSNILLNKANDNTKVTAEAMKSVSMSALKYANEKFQNTPALFSWHDKFRAGNRFQFSV